MANSLSFRCTMAPQSCNFLTARASCSYKIAQILHIAAVHLSGMLKSTGHFSMCPCFSVVHLIESTYLLFTSCNCLPLAYMGRVEAFQLMYIWSYRMHLCTYITVTASLPAGEISHILSTCELCLWSPLHVKCKSRTSSFHCLCLHASERDIPVKAVKGKKPLLLVQGCSFFSFAGVYVCFLAWLKTCKSCPECFRLRCTETIRTAMITKPFCACCLFCDPPASTTMSVCVRIFMFCTRVFSSYHISPVRA